MWVTEDNGIMGNLPTHPSRLAYGIFMVYSIWYIICDVWYMVCSTWTSTSPKTPHSRAFGFQRASNSRVLESRGLVLEVLWMMEIVSESKIRDLWLYIGSYCIQNQRRLVVCRVLNRGPILFLSQNPAGEGPGTSCMGLGPPKESPSEVLRALWLEPNATPRHPARPPPTTDQIRLNYGLSDVTNRNSGFWAGASCVGT